MGVPPYAANAKLRWLGVNNTFQELINTHLASQREHLSITLNGRHVLSSLGIPIPASQCETIQLLLAFWYKIQVAPILWNMNPSLHPGRWMAPGPLIPLGPVM